MCDKYEDLGDQLEHYDRVKRELINDSLEAEHYFTLDELEEYARNHSQRGITVIVKTKEEANNLKEIIKNLTEEELNNLTDQGD